MSLEAPTTKIGVRLQPGNLEDGIAILKRNWKADAGDQDFEFNFFR